MQEIGLQAIPKQSLSVVLNDVLYNLEIIETNGCMSFNLDRAGVRVISGQRIVAGQLLLPYLYTENGQGNFMFLTKDGALPYYDQFVATQTFLYASNAELEAARNGSS